MSINLEWKETAPAVWTADVASLTGYVKIQPNRLKDGYAVSLHVNTFSRTHYGGHELVMIEPSAICGQKIITLESAKEVGSRLVRHWLGFLYKTNARLTAENERLKQHPRAERGEEE